LIYLNRSGEAAASSLDIDLGDVPGFELKAPSQSTGHFRPIIYMTRDDNSALREAAHQSGCLVYLTKPFTARDNRTASNGTTRIPGAARQ